MRLVDDASLTALEGSRPTDELTVWAWRGGSLVLPEPLQIISWSTDDKAGETVKIGQTISLTLADPDGKLGAWRLDDPLGVGGTRLQVIYRVGSAGAINFGWFRITENQPDETVDWRTINEYGHVIPDSAVEPHTRRVPIITAVVRIEAEDLTVNTDRDRLEAPESPRAGATIVSEFRRLTAGHFPTVVDPGVTDRPVSRQLVFDRERLEACQDLLSRIGARYRMGGNGTCHVYTPDAAPVWRVEPTAGLVSVSRNQSLEGLYNRWVVEGKETDDGRPVRGGATIGTGPLLYGGPHGKAPYFYTSEMIETEQQAAEYAAELMEKAVSTLAVELSIETIPWPQGQAGDRIEVGCPFEDRIVYLPGSVTSIRRAGNPVPTGTSLTVSVAYSDVIYALGRTEWAKNLGHPTPELTWDRMPSTWGKLPPLTWDEL